VPFVAVLVKCLFRVALFRVSDSDNFFVAPGQWTRAHSNTHFPLSFRLGSAGAALLSGSIVCIGLTFSECIFVGMVAQSSAVKSMLAPGSSCSPLALRRQGRQGRVSARILCVVLIVLGWAPPSGASAALGRAAEPAAFPACGCRSGSIVARRRKRHVAGAGGTLLATTRVPTPTRAAERAHGAEWNCVQMNATRYCGKE
jgi:hypothetical protein